MELKELESKIQALLKNDNITIKIKDNYFFIKLYNKVICEITFDSFHLHFFGSALQYSTSNKETLQKHKEIIETCLLINDDVEKQLKELVKEYIQ